MNILNDKADSMMVPHGLSLSLYEDDSWTGNEARWDGQPYLDTRRRMACINFDDNGALDGVKDRVTSARAWRTGGANAQGYWYNAASGITVKTTISVGFSSSHTDSSSKSTTETLGVELKRGTEFSGSTISSSFSTTLTTATEDSLTKDASATVEVSCGEQN